MIFEFSQLQLFWQLLLAVILGGLIGLEREYRRKDAGLRTYALLALGAGLFVIVGLGGFKLLGPAPGVVVDPSRIVSAVATGLGFIGAGVIIYRQSHLEGLTTAAGLWTAGAVGAAVGAGFYSFAVFATILALFILEGLGWVEARIFHKRQEPKFE